MLRSINDLQKYSLLADDGAIGRCREFFFDENTWAVRYLVADTRKWLPGRRVLISPLALGEPDWSANQLRVKLTKNDVRRSPAVDTDNPISRENEKEIHEHFGWNPYWINPPLGASAAAATAAAHEQRKQTALALKETDNTLRSTEEVTGYHIHAEDGEVGHVEDFIVDDATWTIHYVVVDTRNVLPGKKVLIAPDWVKNIDWAGQRMEIGLPKDRIKSAPEFNPASPVNREYETRLYDYYGRPAYWL
jgi:hypothetical protein